MPITITITADTGAEAREQLEALLTPLRSVPLGFTIRHEDVSTETRVAGSMTAARLGDVQNAPEAPVRARAPRAKKTEVTEAASPQPSAPAENAGASVVLSESEQSGSATTASEPTYDDVRTAILAVSEAGGRDAVTSVLDQFGVDHANKVAQEQWSELIEVAENTVAEIKAARNG